MMTWYVKKSLYGLAVVNYKSADNLPEGLASEGFYSYEKAFDELERIERRKSKKRSAVQGLALGVLFGLIMISAVG